MTKPKLLVKLRAMEREAQRFEDGHGYDPDNNARLNMAREYLYLLTEGAECGISGDLIRLAYESCLETQRMALAAARAEIEAL